MPIVDVEVIRVAAPEWEPQPGWTTSPMDGLFDDAERYRDHPMGVYNGLVGIRTDPVQVVIVRLTTDEGLTGVGGVALGSEPLATLIEHHLRPLVLGQSPFDTELLWERMFRSTVNIGRKGLVIEAISGLNSPMSEFFPSDYRDGDTFFSELFVGEATVQDGYLTLSDEPGLGVSLNEELVDRYRVPPSH